MANMTNEEIVRINDFFDALEEMITGKFILSDTKIQKILKSIATSSTLYDIFGKCMVGFHFKQELENSTKNTFTLPEGREKVVAYVFCLFLEMDDKRLSLQTFVNDNFYHKDGYNASYHNFALLVLVPFRDHVKQLLEEYTTVKEEEVKVEQTSSPTPRQKVEDHGEDKIYDQMKSKLTTLLISVKQSRKVKNVQSVEMVINAMKEALNLQNWKIINGLLISLDLLLEKEKSVADAYNELKELVYHYFYE